MPEIAQQENPLRDRLVCYQHIPLRWHRLEQPLSDAQWNNTQNDNTKLMEVLVGGEELRDIEISADKDSMKEIKKLDAKLNLLMGWIGQMLLLQQDIAAPQTVCLSTQGLQFHSDDNRAQMLRENEDLYVELFLEPRYPQAFIAVAKVVQITSQPTGVELVVRFKDLSEQNQQWLDKYVFQVHRRQVASSRKRPR